MQAFVRCAAFLLVAVMLTLSNLLSAQSVTYKVIPITSLFDPAGTVLPNDINNHRAVAASDQLRGRPHLGFVWRPGKSTTLPTLGGTCSSAVGISDAGHVVGSSCLPGDSVFHAFLYRKHQMEDLDTFGGVTSFANRVNGQNQVTGSFTTSDGSMHPFFWQKKKWTDLGFLGGSATLVNGLSESGMVTGQSDILNDPDPIFGIPHFHSFTWSNGVLTDLGQIFGSDFGYSVGVDAAGRMISLAHGATTLTVKEISWAAGGSNDNDPADGPPVYTILCPCFGVFWHNGQPIFLNDLVDPQWQLLLGLWINDHGDIVALGQFNGGPFQRVLLKPIPGTAMPSVASERNPSRTQTSSMPRGFHRDRDGRVTVLP
jgi:probable HAF family extracellular repeat protein